MHNQDRTAAPGADSDAPVDKPTPVGGPHPGVASRRRRFTRLEPTLWLLFAVAAVYVLACHR